MADKINLTVSTADGGNFQKSVSYVNIPTDFGSLGILSGHAPMVCQVAKGRLKFRFDGDEQGSVIVGSGIATVGDNEVLLLVNELQY